MAYERSLHGVIPGLLLLALLWERWAGYTWLGMARPTRDLGRSAVSWRAGGGWCSFASTVAGGGRRPRRGCAAVLRRSGRVSRWRVEDAISRYLT
jgi:hypothetical protein